MTTSRLGLRTLPWLVSLLGLTFCDSGNSLQTPTCSDGIKNETETDTDCGGSSCNACATGQACAAATDCLDGVCTAGVCIAASCTDGVKNAPETDVDCGGGSCRPCALRKVCAADSDCWSAACDAKVCVVPPTIVSVTAARGPLAGGTKITITGTGFVMGAAVTIDGIAATNVTVVSAWSITAIVPKGTQIGPVDVVVTNPSARTATSTKAFFYYYGTVSFSNPMLYTTDAEPFGIVNGDFNGDGKLDLATTNYGAATLSVLLGKGDGTFQPQVTYGIGTKPKYLATADLNGDNKLDIVTPNRGSNSVSVLIGNGDGTFKPQMIYPTGMFPSNVVIGDFNGDQKPDLATNSESVKTFGILLGNGDGTFQANVDYPTPSPSTTLVAGDVNGDNKPDFVMCAGPSRWVSFGNGDGTFGATTQTSDIRVWASQAVLIYLTSAKKLYMASAGGGVGIAQIYPNGSIDGARLVSTEFGATGLTIGDINRDGDLDLVSGNSIGASVSVLILTSGFDQAINLPTGGSTNGVTVGDWNGDGKPDIAAAVQGANGVSVLLSTAQ